MSAHERDDDRAAMSLSIAVTTALGDARIIMGPIAARRFTERLAELLAEDGWAPR